MAWNFASAALFYYAVMYHHLCLSVLAICEKRDFWIENFYLDYAVNDSSSHNCFSRPFWTTEQSVSGVVDLCLETHAHCLTRVASFIGPSLVLCERPMILAAMLACTYTALFLRQPFRCRQGAQNQSFCEKVILGLSKAMSHQPARNHRSTVRNLNEIE